MKKTFDEIVNTITDELGISVSDFGHEDFDRKEVEEKLGPLNTVYEEGGGEGGGEHVEKVWEFKDHGVLIRLTGSYYSYDGTNWDDDFEEVFSRRVIATVYETASQRGTKVDEA